MVINRNGQPLYTNKSGNVIGVGRLWFFMTKDQAKNYIRRRNSKGLDLDKIRTIVRVEWELLFKESTVVWIQDSYT